MYLTEDVKKKAASWYGAADNLSRAIDAALLDGYRISLKMDAAAEGSYVCMMTAAANDHRDAGWALTERGADWYKAMCRAMFIHHVVLEGDWSGHKQRTFLEEEW